METKKGFEKYIVDKVLIVKDSEVFKIAYTPDQIVERKESQDLYREGATFVNYRKPNHILTKGPPGTGKTVTVNFISKVIEKMKPDIKVFNVNCAGKAAVDILDVLNNDYGKVGYPQQIKHFLENLENDSLIILDEIDRSHKIDTLLYNLSRPSEVLPSFKKNISLILISNNMRWEDFLKDSTRSSLQLKTIIFAPYNADKLKHILKKRIKQGFYKEEAIKSGLIDLICQETADKRRGDCRVAIEALFYAAQNAEMQKREEVNLDDVRSALKISISAVDKERLCKLSDLQLATLYCCLFEKDTTLTSFYKSYLRATETLQLKKQSITMVFHMLNYLDDLGIIDKSVEVLVGLKTPRRMLKIHCNVEESVILDELRIRDFRFSRSRDSHQDKKEGVKNEKII